MSALLMVIPESVFVKINLPVQKSTLANNDHTMLQQMYNKQKQVLKNE